MEDLHLLTNKEYFTDLCDSISDHILKSPSPEIANILSSAVFEVAKVYLRSL